MDELLKYRKAALVNGLCNEYKGYWQAAGNDKLKLITLAMCQQSIPHVATYAYNGQGLTKEYILDNFKDYINGKTKILDADGVEGYTYALYIAENRILVPPVDVSHLMWCKDITLQINACKCPFLYISNNSDIRLVLNGFNNVKIYLFDESSLTIDDADETCSATIYKYSDKCNVKYGKFCLSKRIKEHRKELRL